MIIFLPNPENLNSPEHQQMMEEYKNKFENKIKELMYDTLLKYPDEFVNGEYILNKIKNLDMLIEKYKLTEEYEKCDFLNKLKKRIVIKEENIKQQ